MSHSMGWMSTIMIIVAACCWGCMGIMVRTLNAIGLSTMEIVQQRSTVTFAIMIMGALLINRKAFVVKVKDLWYFVGTGICSIVFFNYCYFRTIEETSLSVAAILLYTSPFFVSIMSSILFHEKITTKKVICMGVAFAGCVLVSGAMTGQMVLSIRGIIIGLGAGFGYALYSIFGKYATERGYSSVTITLYTFLFATIGGLPFVNIKNIYNVYMLQPESILVSVLLIIITTVIPYLCYTYGLSGTMPGVAAILATIEPVAATMVGVFIYGEIPNAMTIIGIICVICAILIANRNIVQRKIQKK